MRALAGERVFGRGEKYYAWGQVIDYAEWGDGATARVLGERVYRASLRWAESGPEFRCDCPMGARGEFCKHAVALGLRRLKAEREPAGEPQVMRLINDYLSGRGGAEEVERQMAAAMEDDRLRRRWYWRAAGAAGQPLEAASLRREVEHAISCLSLGEAETDEERFDRLEFLFGSLAEEGFAEVAVELSERALELGLEAGAGRDDDEAAAQARRLEELYLLACRAAGQEPRAVFERLPDQRAGAGDEKRSPGEIAWSPTDGGDSEPALVRMNEQEVEAAWQSARWEGCSDETWLKLAARRARKHPEDSLAVYQRLIARALGRKNNYAAREAIGLLKRVRRLMRAMGDEAGFARYLESLRRSYRSHRNFMRLLEPWLGRYGE